MFLDERIYITLRFLFFIEMCLKLYLSVSIRRSRYRRYFVRVIEVITRVHNGFPNHGTVLNRVSMYAFRCNGNVLEFGPLDTLRVIIGEPAVIEIIEGKYITYHAIIHASCNLSIRQ